MQITRQTRRLDVSHNLLGTDGTLTLIQGLTSLRGRYSTPDFGLWGLTEINLGCNGIEDKAVDAIMGYAKKDVMLRKVLLQGNEIQVSCWLLVVRTCGLKRGQSARSPVCNTSVQMPSLQAISLTCLQLHNNVESILHSLNSSRLQSLSLTNNRSLLPASVSRLFSSLSTSYLTELHLSICNLGPTSVGDIIAYLRSPRSRNLELLELNGNALGVTGVTSLIDAVDSGNFTMRHLGLFGCDSRSARRGRRRLDDDGDIDMDAESGSGSGSDDGESGVSLETKQQRTAEKLALEYQTSDRLPPILMRNHILTRRVRSAAARCLPYARLLLNARPPEATVVAIQAIENISNGTTSPYFRLLDLPQEILHLVVRHTSGDPSALSDAQFARLRKDAQGKEGLHRVERIWRAKQRPWSDKAGIKEASRQVRDDWLKWGKWDKWECDAPPDTRNEG